MATLCRTTAGCALLFNAVTASIMIPTRNRCADLQATCQRLVELQPQPNEVLICADGCNDGTAEMLRADFPRFRFIENQPATGSVEARNRLLIMATGDIVVSLDDDSYPVDKDFIGKLTAAFDAHPEAAVITFPQVRNPEYSTAARSGHFVSAYANCAAAMRREVYFRTSGYPGFFFHGYEEPDFALQCYAAGYGVWFEPSLPVRHHLSAANRSAFLFHQSNARNELWSVWLRCPLPWLPLVSLYRVWRQFRYSVRQGWSWALQEPRWWLAAFCGLGACYRARRPLPWRVYYSWMRLAREPIYTMAELRAKFSATADIL